MYVVKIECGRDGKSPRYKSDDKVCPDSYWTDKVNEAFRIRSRRLAEKHAASAPYQPAFVEQVG